MFVAVPKAIVRYLFGGNNNSCLVFADGAMSPLLGGHLHLARDSHITEEEDILPLARLKGAIFNENQDPKSTALRFNMIQSSFFQFMAK